MKAFLSALALCFLASVTHAREPVKVLSSIRPLALIAQDIGGELVQSDTLWESSVSPHHANVSIAQALKIKQADLVLWIGPRFELHLNKALSKRDAQTLLGFAQSVGSSDELDQHVWMSPRYARSFAAEFTQALKKIAPERSVELDERLAQFAQSLEKSESRIQKVLAGSDGSYGVYHPAYTHFERYFGLKNLGYFADTPESQVSFKKLASLKKELAGAECILAERGESALARQYAAKLDIPLIEVDVLDIGGVSGHYAQYLENIAQSFQACLGAGD